MAGGLAQRLGGATTLWQGVCVLLEEWRARLPADGGARAQNDDRYLGWSDLVAEAVDYFDQHGVEFDEAARQRVLAWTSDGANIDAVDAVACGRSMLLARQRASSAIDSTRGFPSAWRDELRAAGELYPVADVPTEMFVGLPLSSRAHYSGLNGARRAARAGRSPRSSG